MINVESVRLDQEMVHSELGEWLSVDINPRLIAKSIRKEFKVGNDFLQNRQFFRWFVVGGDWDTNNELFNKERNYAEILDLINYESEFRSSPSYKRCVSELQAGFPQKGFDGIPFKSKEDVENTFNYYLELISSMRENGYLPQKILLSSKKDSDIGIAISSTSEFFHFRTGHHRLAIAQLLNIPTVRAKVQIVHPTWLSSKGRDPVASGLNDILEGLKLKIREIDELHSSK
jgi:hypothetical protein